MRVSAPIRVFIAGSKAHAPARHGIGLGQRLEFDGDILGAVHLQDGGRRLVAEIDIGIGQIADSTHISCFFAKA